MINRTIALTLILLCSADDIDKFIKIQHLCSFRAESHEQFCCKTQLVYNLMTIHVENLDREIIRRKLIQDNLNATRYCNAYHIIDNLAVTYWIPPYYMTSKGLNFYAIINNSIPYFIFAAIPHNFMIVTFKNYTDYLPFAETHRWADVPNAHDLDQEGETLDNNIIVIVNQRKTRSSVIIHDVSAQMYLQYRGYAELYKKSNAIAIALAAELFSKNMIGIALVCLLIASISISVHFCCFSKDN